MNELEDFSISFTGYFPRYDNACRVNSISYELQYVADGGAELNVEGRHYELDGGSGWLIHPGIVYDYRPMADYGFWEHRFIVFKGTITERWKAEDLLPALPWKNSTHLNIGAKMDRVIELSRQWHDRLSRREAANLLEKIFIDLKRLDEHQSTSWLGAIMAYLEAENTPDYADLASRHGMSRRTLFRRFREETGYSPHQYHLEARVKQALRLLETTALPLKEIAFRLGYADPAHFARQFKASTGRNPGEVRR